MHKLRNNSIYYVVTTAAPNEERMERRCRTRLRTGKILGTKSAYLADCQIFDRSSSGARLRLFTNARLPSRITLFDEISQKLTGAKIIWRRQREIGIAFLPFACLREPSGAELSRLRARYNPAKN
ncbi:MAG: hypothetical protein J2P49_05375 [Methylocapsa sp.]|nr:hypothetical protein [Methylocapsa sp.]